MSDKEDWVVGDRVQWIDYTRDSESYGTIFGGVVEEVTKATREKYGYSRYGRPQQMEEYVSHVTIKWDDGEVETLESYQVSPEDSEMEREFRKVAPGILDQINEKLSLSAKYLDEAEAIAEEHGIPFSSGISPLSQNYLTRSFRSKWEEVSKEVVQEVTETYQGDGDYYGWQHSAVCY